MRIALGIAYDGSGYPGWQTQPGGQAIQDLLEASLTALAGHTVATVCAGRTDAGVHALAQVVHFDTTANRPLNAWVRGTNARLPDRVTVQWAVPVSDDFHARFSARSRTYRYLIYCAAVPHPLWRTRAGWAFRPIAIGPMREAAASLLGEHDFSAFRSSQCQAASPVRCVESIGLDQRGDFIELTITANAFLHHMVRNIVGSLVEVGIGRKPATWLAELLLARRRELAAPTYSAAGLYFASVGYEALHGVPTAILDPLSPSPPQPSVGTDLDGEWTIKRED